MVLWLPTYGISTPYWWHIESPTHGISTPTMVFWPSYPWYIYIDPPIHGILTPYPWCFDPIPMVHRPPYPWYFYLLTVPMVYRIPYPWYFDPLPISWLEMRGSKYHGGSIYHTGGSIYHGGQNTIWHRSFLHSWTITGFVIRLTRRIPLVKQEQLTFLEHPSSVPVFSGACVTRSLVLCVCFVDHCLSFCPVLPLCCPSFDLRILITPFGFGILKLFLRKAVIHFPIGSYVKNCHVSGS
jgi:hypothetical protein